ncbi:hypothetical protein K491DRAFT_431312 [Lophiostoma macrostomum CBS 122681]|uniref:Uncharacterized protein n=1 Tax=Lophiostoma macrostomum CBS 122681 TaxID=1314788 RepID=A0A6A6T699_9PLEO|nr:hypothetical protein K491DRAFT_431312 [Lophiostoma macrostomum CBS 122681]
MRSRTYSWIIFVASQTVVEMAWQTVTSVSTFVTWYYLMGLWRNGNAASSMNERAALKFSLRRGILPASFDSLTGKFFGKRAPGNGI